MAIQDEVFYALESITYAIKKDRALYLFTVKDSKFFDKDSEARGKAVQVGFAANGTDLAIAEEA